MGDSQLSTKTLSPARTFTRFGFLPKEIRDMIWDLATRDRQRGTHFFSLLFDHRKGNLSVEYMIHCKGWHIDPLGVMTYFDSAAAGALSYNPSTYLVDGGLWTACRESRDAMVRRYRQRIQDRPCSFPAPGLAIGSAAGRTGTSTHRNAEGDEEERYFTLLTGDLVCYRLRDLADLEEEDLMSFCLLNSHGSCAVHDYALEFDSTWDSPSKYDFRKLVEFKHLPRPPKSVADKKTFALICATIYLPNLWFIDYRIRRSKDFLLQRQHQSGIRDDRAVFYGNGCRFVEVRPSDAEWEFEDGTPLSREGRNIFGFLDAFEHAAHLYKNYKKWDGDEEEEDPGFESDEDYEFEGINFWEHDESWFRHHETERGAHFGVLACEAYE